MKTLELRLDDAQYDALVAEAKASGQRLYDYCRTRLLGQPAPAPIVKTAPAIERRPLPAASADTARLDRLEAMVANLVEMVGGQVAAPVVEGGGEDVGSAPAQVDVDAVVAAQVATADTSGARRRRADDEDDVGAPVVRALQVVSRPAGKLWANRYAAG